MDLATKANLANARADAGLEPRGGRIGVAFDWGFGVQLASMGLVTLAGLPIAGMTAPRLAGVGMLGVAAVAFAQGEALRRGRDWAWWVQVLGNGALTVIGLAGLPMSLQLIQQGRIGMIFPLLLMAIVSPIECWLLLQPGSRRWYGHVASDAARARHSGPWMTGTLAWALACGLIQAAVVLFGL
jgi:hypothetical protein